MGESTPPSAAYDPKAKLRRAIEALRRPAGDDPRFSSFDSIAAHRDDFVVQVHTTWKRLHVQAIEEIVNIEALLTRGDVQKKMPAGFVSWLRHVRRLWRRVNDAIAWGMIGKPHIVRRLCAYRARPTLIESNPATVAAILDDINESPMSMAIWNDATTCIDVADITCRRGSAGLEFIELKEGKVNQAIHDLHKSLTRHRKAGDQKAAEGAMDEFFASYGAKGFKQAMRVTKQLMRDSRVMDIVNRDIGPDPDLEGATVEMVESSVQVECYDDELSACLRHAEAHGAATACIDGCLWIYASSDLQLTRRDAVTDFAQQIFAASAQTEAWLRERTGKRGLNAVRSVDEWSFMPTGIPLFLRPLPVDDVLDLVYGRWTGRVLLFFDWLRFEDVVRKAGCALTWVKPKPEGAKHIEYIVGKRTPRIGRNDGRGIRLGGAIVREMLADGIRPSSAAAQYAALLDRAPVSEES